MESDSYCRDIEAYVCRKNDGHLVRVVGPAFNMVSGWAASGIPFKIACQGIDRCFERYYAKGPRRRPVRVEFCEADVLDAFDQWKRAVGIGTAGSGGAILSEAAGQADGSPEGETDHSRRPAHSLRAHLDRVATRLTDLQVQGAALPPALDAAVVRVIDWLAVGREASRTLRGAAREAYLVQLEARDDELLEVASAVTPADVLASLQERAAEELSAFRSRMDADAYARALGRARARLLRERWKLPTITYSA